VRQRTGLRVFDLRTALPRSAIPNLPRTEPTTRPLLLRMPTPALRRVVLAAVAAFAGTAAATGQIVTYQGVSSAAHQAQFATLPAQGYRLISLAVAGGLASPTYAAVWEQVGGPGWASRADMTPSQYVAQRTTWLGLGYRPKVITAAGSGADTVLAAVFVADGATVTGDHAYGSLTALNDACELARAQGRIPVSIDVYGPDRTPLFAAVFEPNPSGTAWGHEFDGSHAQWLVTYGAHTSADARLRCLGMSDHQDYVSVFYDDRVGTTAMRSDATPAAFATQAATLANSGYGAHCIAAGGSGSTLRIAGAFAAQRQPSPRTFTRTGQSRPEFAAFDAYMQSRMTSRGVRAGSIAITRHGRLVYARGYTWAEAGYPITQPTSLFRVASVAKVSTAIAIHELVERGTTSYLTRPQAELNIPYGAATGGDPRFTNVTVQHCLEYLSGLPRNYYGGEIAEWWAAATQTPLSLPTTRARAEAWTGTVSLRSTPGSVTQYGNVPHFLLGQIVEDRTGQPFETWLQSNIHQPLGITRARVAASTRSQLAADETLSHVPVLELAPSELHSDQRPLAVQYGADLLLKAASGGLAYSTVDSVRLLAGVLDLGDDSPIAEAAARAEMTARHTFIPGAPEGLPQICPLSMSWEARSNGVFAYKKGGTLSSASSEVVWRTDGIAIAVFFNLGDAHADTGLLNTYAEQVTTWPSDDLFPSCGLPPFVRTPVLTGTTVGSVPHLGDAPLVFTGQHLDGTTAVQFGTMPLLSQAPTTWPGGWFRRTSATQLEVFPPQGLPPGQYAVRASSPAGTSSARTATLTANPAFTLGAPATVTAVQAFPVLASRGPVSTAGLLVFGISPSSQPSVSPGIVTLGLGNQWTDLITSPVVTFDPVTGIATLPIPPLPWPAVWLQAAALDPASATPFPLPTTNVRQVQVR
jgi:CubicO group peptidase (beta-lactamase class C family)